MVTENGIAAEDDSLRAAFIKEALRGVENCVADGLPAVGYIYWSLLDNLFLFFETAFCTMAVYHLFV